jgi:hypothetical protein
MKLSCLPAKEKIYNLLYHASENPDHQLGLGSMQCRVTALSPFTPPLSVSDCCCCLRFTILWSLKHEFQCRSRHAATRGAIHQFMLEVMPEITLELHCVWHDFYAGTFNIHQIIMLA